MWWEQIIQVGNINTNHKNHAEYIAVIFLVIQTDFLGII